MLCNLAQRAVFAHIERGLDGSSTSIQTAWHFYSLIFAFVTRSKRKRFRLGWKGWKA